MPWKEIIVIGLVLLLEKKKVWDLHSLAKKVAVLNFCVLYMNVSASLVCILGNEYIFVRFLLICDFMISLCDFLKKTYYSDFARVSQYPLLGKESGSEEGC